jgi:hypothetical protein
MDEGLAEFKGQSLEILLTERVMWCEVLKSATQSLTKLVVDITMVLKEFASDRWSQPTSFQGA